MKTCQVTLSKKDFTINDLAAIQAINPQWITVFGHLSFFESGHLGKQLKGFFPSAEIIGCSSAGEISNQGVFDQRLVVTGVHFEKVQLKSTFCEFQGNDKSEWTGQQIAQRLAGKNRDDVSGLFVLNQGVNVNGGDFITGLKENLHNNTVITGGLAGDGGAFKKTYVLCNDKVSSDMAAAVAFYGPHLQIGSGSMGGWEPFGPVRQVTRSNKNILYTLDGEPALELYKKYLGERAKDLPSSGLYFPFSILKNNGDQLGLIRTVLGVNESDGSLIFAGDMPEKSLVRLMTAKNSDLTKGALKAAEDAVVMNSPQDDHSNQFSILVSCVGRKLVMSEDVDDEVEAVQTIMKNATITGFYSYGEIGPFQEIQNCKLHNQTITVTHFVEKAG